MLFHVFAHVQADNIVFRIKKRLGQSLGKLGLAHARGPQENKGACGPRGIRQAGAGAQHGIGHGGDSLILAHHPLMQLVGQAQQLFTLGLQQPGHRNAGPLGHDFSHIVRAHFLAQQARGVAFPPFA